MFVVFLVVRNVNGEEAWRINVEGMRREDVFDLALNIIQTLASGYGIAAVY